MRVRTGQRIHRLLTVLAAVLAVALTPAAIAHAAAAAEADALQPALAAAQPDLAAADDPVVVEYFYGEECPYCHMLEPRLAELADDHPGIHLEAYEVWHDADNRQRFVAVAEAHGVEAQGVPATFALGRVWVGFSEELWAEMEAVLVAAGDAAVAEAGPTQPPADTPEAEPSDALELPFIGAVDPAEASLLGSTALIAFVDGFNPCSLWVLTVLLAMTLHARSRRRLLLVGGTFLLVTAALYGVFIAGLFTVLSYVAYLGWIQLVVAAIALVFALVAIKDFFWFKRGVSLSIPEWAKPRIYRGSRSLAVGERSPAALVGGTAVLALGVGLVELPCTAGFPLLWSSALAAQGVEGTAFLGLLGVYLGVYLLDEIAVVVAVVATMRIGKFQERHGRLLKLIGGSLMLALAVTILFRPEVMSDLGGTLVVFAAALVLSTVLYLIERLVRRRRGPDPADTPIAQSRRREPVA